MMPTENGAKPRLGFIGLGRMGSRMARRLLDAGYPLDVFNRTLDKTRPLAEAGARVHHTPRALAAESEVVLSSLADDAAVTETLLGPEGALAGARPGSVLLDLSSVYPATSRAVFRAAQSRRVSMLDAPVAGSTGPAEQGRLLIMVGGECDTFERCQPLFDVLGRASFYLGPSGAGSTMKLVNNAILAMEMQALAEAIALGEKAGLPRAEMLAVLGETGVVAPAQTLKLDNARDDRYPIAFLLGLMAKDLGNALRLAQEVLAPMPVGAVTRQVQAAEQGLGIDEDYSTVIRLMRELAHVAPSHADGIAASSRSA
jgi:3-hydroxyisobutyrate dehydrogenase-like beta-hydroxyacid dehydrogenase